MYSMMSWLWKGLLDEILSLPGRATALFACILLFIVPLITQNTYILGILIMANIFAIFAASWDLLSGYVGQLSLGHAVFFGIAAYSTALLNLNFGWQWWITVPLGALVAVAAGLVVGIPALRLKGPYLSLVTLAFPVILIGFIYVFRSFTGGELGIWGITRLASSRVTEYYISLLAMLGLGFIMWKITDSKIGIIFHAIREDEITARASGINTTKYKLIAFSLSSFFAGIAGGLAAHFLRIAGPSTLDLMTSFQPIIWTIFGGAVTIYGAVIGTLILYPAMEFLRIIPELRILIFASIVLIVLRFMPEGLITGLLHKIEKECPRCKSKNAFTRKSCRICMIKFE